MRGSIECKRLQARFNDLIVSGNGQGRGRRVDIDAVLTGVSGATALRGVLASLDSKQQALLLGHAVPMPVVIKTRTYGDDAFRASMGTFTRDVAAADEKLEEMDDWSS